MASSFYGFEIAKSGLFAAQRAIDLTGHNISNVNTAGYTRQRLIQSAVDLNTLGERFKSVVKGYSGTGVTITGVEQVRNSFLDRQFRREYGQQEMWGTRADSLSYVESLFDDMGDTGLSTDINRFFTSLESLTQSPESKEYRTNVIQTALNMASNFKHLYTQLQDKADEQNNAVNVTVTQINDITKNIASLNEQIYRFELGGDTANDLRDQRNTLLDALSGLADITYSENASGQLTVDMAGKTLVSHTTTYALTATQDVTNPFTGAANSYYSVNYTDPATGVTSVVTPSSGKLKAYLDMRDGNSASNQGLPYYVSRLNTLADTIAHQFNLIHAAGYTLPDASNGNTSAMNINFFTQTYDALGNRIPITANTMDVDSAVKNNPYNIAASDVQITDPTLRGNNANAIKLVNLQDNINIPSIGSIEGYLKGMLAEIGSEASHTNQMYASQQVLVTNLDNQKQSISAVSLDEETTNLIKFQQAYSASARVITTIDEYLDVLINKMGLVGR